MISRWVSELANDSFPGITYNPVPFNVGFRVWWASFYVLVWWLLNNMGTWLCVKVLNEVLIYDGKPENFCIDQYSQFNSFALSSGLKVADVTMPTDGPCQHKDNIPIERPRRWGK